MSPTPIETADTARAMHAAEIRGLDMQDGPEQIWAVASLGMVGSGRWVTQGTENPHGNIGYTRDDLVEALKAEKAGLEDILFAVTIATATGMGLTPEQTIRIHLIADIRENDPPVTVESMALRLIEADAAAAKIIADLRAKLAVEQGDAAAARKAAATNYARVVDLERALRFGCAASINSLHDESGQPPEWGNGSGISVMLKALGCDSPVYGETVRRTLTDPTDGATKLW